MWTRIERVVQGQPLVVINEVLSFTEAAVPAEQLQLPSGWKEGSMMDIAAAAMAAIGEKNTADQKAQDPTEAPARSRGAHFARGSSRRRIQRPARGDRPNPRFC